MIDCLCKFLVQLQAGNIWSCLCGRRLSKGWK